MSNWTLIQVIFDLFVCATIFTIFWRLRRPPQDDPRLSRGLQLLQTKITVLEDLSDRTEAQVKQLTTIIDQKTRALQNKVIEAEQQILKIDHSVKKSKDQGAAEVIPQAELLERRRTVEYVKAAKMANSGMSVDDITEHVNLPREQVELIAKFNRDQLMFDESQLPDWAAHESDTGQGAEFGLNNMDFVGNLDRPTTDYHNVEKLESEFKRAVADVKKANEAAQLTLMETKMAETIKASLANKMDTVQPAVMAVRATAQTLKEKIVATAEDMLKQQSINQVAPESKSTSSAKVTVKKVIFPKIEKSQP